MITEVSKGVDTAQIGAMLDLIESFKHKTVVTLQKFEADIDTYREKYGKAEGERLFYLENAPLSVEQFEDNILVYGGMSCMWQCLIGNGTATAGQALTYFNNAQAAIGVGDSSTAEAATQTDLQAATNKLRVAMDATFPTHTDGVTSASNVVTFKSTFTSGQANYVWAEWAVFNSATPATGRMLNRKVQALGTKSTGSWSLTVTVTLS